MPDFSSLAHDGVFWRRVAELGAQKGPEWLVRHAPALFGTAAVAILHEKRGRVIDNLHRIRGKKSRLEDAADVARTFRAYAGCLGEVLSAGSKNASTPDAVLVGRRHMDRAVAMKKGILLATIHSAGWELVGPLLASYRKSELVMVMEGERDPRARAIQDRARRAAGRIRVVHVGEDPLSSLPLLRHLRDGDTVALQVDRVPEGMRSVGVTLLGAPWRMPLGPLRIAQVSGAPLVPIFSARTGYRRYVIEAHPPVVLSRKAGETELAAAAQRIAHSIGEFLREYPTQWFHFKG
jgi:KDO2-lipid IV(A) lauroyltransferase